MGFLGDTFSAMSEAIITSFNQNKPQIGIYGGLASIIVGGIMACVATSKNRDILEEATNEIKKVEKAAEENVISEEQAKKDILKIKAKAGRRVIVNYLPAVTLELAGCAAIVGGERTLNERNNKSVAAVIAAEETKNLILDRVEKKYGKKAKDEILFDIHQERQEEEVVKDPDTGKEKKRMTKKNIAGEDARTGFKITLNRYNWKLWENDFETNISKLRGIQAEANDDLMRAVAFNNGNGAVKMASDILRLMEVTTIDDPDVARSLKDKGCPWTPSHPVAIDFDLDGAQALKDFSVVDEDEIQLNINFVDNVWSYK